MRRKRLASRHFWIVALAVVCLSIGALVWRMVTDGRGVTDLESDRNPQSIRNASPDTAIDPLNFVGMQDHLLSIRQPTRSDPSDARPLTTEYGTVIVSVIQDDTEQPLAGVGVYLVHAWSTPPLFASSDSKGRVCFQMVLPGRKGVRGDRSGSVPVDVRRGEQSEVQLRISSGHAFVVHVHDTSDYPVSGAAVHLSSAPMERGGERIGLTDAFGRFELRGAAEGRLLTVAARGYLASPSFPVSAHLFKDGVIPIVLARGGVSVQGSVVDAASGKPISGARIEIGGGTFVAATVSINDRSLVVPGPAPIGCLTDEAGSFCLADVPIGVLSCRVDYPSYASWIGSITIQDVNHSQLRVALTRSNPVRGIVVDGRGLPVVDALVTTGDEQSPYYRFAYSDEAGEFCLPGLSVGEHEIRGSFRDGSTGRLVTFVPFTNSALKLELSSKGSITGVLLDDRGIPLARWEIGILPRPPVRGYAPRVRTVSRTDSEGRFEIGGEGSDPIWLVVGPPAPQSPFPMAIHEAIWGSKDLIITLDESARPSCSLEINIDLSTEDGVRSASILLTQVSTGLRYLESVDPRGVARITHLAPGGYEVDVVLAGEGVYSTGQVFLNPSQDLVLAPVSGSQIHRLPRYVLPR